MRRAFLFLAALGAPATALAQAEADSRTSVVIRTKDGNEVRGTVSFGSFKLESSVGTLDISLSNVRTIAYGEESATVKLRDGSSFVGKLDLASWRIKSTVGDLTIESAKIQLVTVYEGNLPGHTGPKPGAAAQAPKLEVAASLPLTSLVSRESFLAADGSALILALPGDSKIVRISAADLKPQGEVALPVGFRTFSPTADRSIGFAAFQNQVTVVDLREFKVLKTFAIEDEVASLLALDASHVLAATIGDVVVVSVPKQSVVHRFRGPNGRFHRTPDGSRALDPQGVLRLPQPGKPFDVKALQWSPDSYRNSFNFLVISDDGRFAVGATQGGGQLYRLGRSYLASLTEVASVEAHASAAFIDEGRSLLLFTEQGFMKEWSIHPAELKKSVEIGVPVRQAFVDGKGGALFIAAGPRVSAEKVQSSGVLYRFALPR